MGAPAKNILVTGANGQLGSGIRELRTTHPLFRFTFTDRDELDITSAAAVEKTLSELKPAFLINCAAYTAVDKAEQEEALASLVNSTAPGILAAACKKHSAKLIHISTDYVFDGMANTPYHEASAANPLSVYGRTKLAGEQHVLKSGVGMVIRTSWLYSARGSNFVKTILKHGSLKPELSVVFDQIGTPTWACDLARVVLAVVGSGNSGFRPELFHYSNEGVCSWFDLAHAVVSLAGLRCKVKPIETKDYPTPAARPQYSVLNKQKIRTLYGVEIPHWHESLAECLKQMLIDG